MTAADVELYKLLRQDAGLKKLTEVANFHEYHDGMEIIRDTKWATYLGTERPALLLQGAAKADGTADNIFFVKGPVMKSAKLVIDLLVTSIRKYSIYLALPAEARTQRWRPLKCPDGTCPRTPRQPAPTPDPLVDPTTPPAVVVPVAPITPFDINVLLDPDDGVDVKVEVPTTIEAPSTEAEEGIPVLVLLLIAAAGFAGYVVSQKS